MAVLKYKDPETGEIKKVGIPSITPEDIGAVKKTGDKMTGTLGIENSNPYISLKDTTENTEMVLRQLDKTASIATRDTADSTDKYRMFRINNHDAVPNVAQALQFIDQTAADTYSTYNVLHTGNLDLIPTNRGTAIHVSADLDTYQTPGYYYVANKDDAETIANTPFTGGGYNLIVRQGYGGGGHLYQFAITSHPRIYWRQRSGGTWGGWRSVIDSSGGTATGNITVSSASPQLSVIDTTTNAQGALWQSDNQTVLSNRNVSGSTTNQRSLVINNSAQSEDLDYALRLYTTVDETKAWYNVLHTGNTNRTTLVSTATTPTVNNEINWVYE